MEDRRLIYLILAVFAAAPTAAFAYEVNTHQGLTQATVQAYEKLHGDIFTSEQEQKVIGGSAFEDDGTRSLNHFYDPINYRGLTIGRIKAGEVSEEWSQDTEGQGNYCDWRLCSKRIGYNDKLFSSPTDFSWDRAIYEYVYGDKARALETIGHILHLLQDATVPAHVRNDQHLNHNGFGDTDSYEAFTSAFGLGQVTVPSTLNAPEYSNINSYFDHVANFTNKHFVSKDTLFKDYNLPSFDKSNVKDGFAYDQTGLRIARVETVVDRFTHKVLSTDIIVDSLDHLVASDYWNTLSKESIQNGVGIIDLFFKKAEEEKNTGVLKARNISAAEKNAKDTARNGFKFVKALYGSSLNQNDVNDLLNEGQVGAAALAVAEKAPVQEEVISSDQPPTVQQKTARQEPPPLQPVSLPANNQLQVQPPKQTNQIIPGFGGGGPAPTSDTDASSPVPTPVVVPIGILSPAENASFATTSISFTGTTSATALVTASFATTTATTTANGSGNWSLAFMLLEGTTTVSFVASDNAGHASATTTRAVAVDLTPPGTPSVTINECNFSLTTSTCFIATTTVTISWNAISDASYYGLVKNGALGATTTATTASASAGDNATTTFAVVAYDSAGNAATSTSKSAEVSTRPLVINEIAWAGTDASDSDEWIELKNVSGYTLDLARAAISAADGSPYIQLSGTVGALDAGTNNDMYLIERASEATTASLAHNPTIAFAQLSDSGEELRLEWGHGSASTTIDATPAVSACGGWCAGSLSSSTGFSVQFGTTTAKLTMERKSSSLDSALAGSWRSNDTYTTYEADRAGNVIYGTPSQDNSAGLPTSGWFCSPDTTSITSGVHYTPSTSGCTYLARFISTQANRHGGLYLGDVASSTGGAHFLGKAFKKDETDSISSPLAGEHFFIAIWEDRSGPAFDNDAPDFNSYFQTGLTTTSASTPPHSNYVVIPWIYGP